jgi:hypothetical protein
MGWGCCVPLAPPAACSQAGRQAGACTRGSARIGITTRHSKLHSTALTWGTSAVGGWCGCGWGGAVRDPCITLCPAPASTAHLIALHGGASVHPPWDWQVTVAGPGARVRSSMAAEQPALQRRAALAGLGTRSLLRTSRSRCHVVCTALPWPAAACGHWSRQEADTLTTSVCHANQSSAQQP